MAKVMFGISNLHVGTWTENTTTSGTTITLGTPYHQKGAVSFTPSTESNQNDFYADNIIYWSGYSGGKIEGDLTCAMFDDNFKKNFLGYKTLTTGGVAAVKNPTIPNVYIGFEVDTDDAHPIRVMLYNCTMGAVSREYETIGENKEPKTASVPVTCVGDNVSGVTMAVFKYGDSGYNNLFTSPSAPVLTTA